ncbi:MAG: nuclear transport factor 2 family protein [Ketobacteraceae bacterium]|nr:nuclear transport factor 2 family protein [Ketobacteraceae bacterium]
MQQELSGRLQALLDKDAIRELIHAYCNAADRKDVDKMRSLYHEDAIDDHGGFFQGLAMEFIDQLPEIQAPMEILHHNVTTVNIRLEDRPGGARYGEGEVYVLAFHKVSTGEGSLDLLIGGRYLDKYEKREGEWRFSHRAVLADWVNVHDPSLVDLNHPIIQGSLLGKPGPDDPSYHFFRLFQRGE